ncbi:uncharacterized protein CEXT_310771 [Caerostris extrusa]|uniref:Uncharacterized protein n=1 Tax=Caerostris extrusa TaxID=172846 RepID=A0AAV4S9K8_CAEEX|nr:uncharacterized protein CEXT_310771 [Caerostris extrusa]
MSDYLPMEECGELLPECECEYTKGYLNDVELTCHNVSDFEAFNDILSNGSVFEVNTTFQISLSGNSILPKGFLSGLTVSVLSVDDFQTQVEEGVFDGVLYIKYFYVERSSMKLKTSVSSSKGSYTSRHRNENNESSMTTYDGAGFR